MTATRHLLTFLTGDDADLNLARRHLAYDRLVLVVTPAQEGHAEDLAARERAIAGPDAAIVIALPPHNVYDTLDRLRTFLDGLPDGDTVTLNLAGADPAHVGAATVLAFDRGIHTVLCQHGQVVALPVLFGIKVQDRFDPDERRLLSRLTHHGESVEHLAQHLLTPKERLHRAGRILRDKGLVQVTVADGTTRLALTQQGARLRDHVL